MTLDSLSIYPNQWIEFAGVPPLDPIGPPRLIPDRSTERAGQFIVDLSDAAPKPREGESIDRSAILSVTFLFRFEEVNTSNVSFNWTVSKDMIVCYVRLSNCIRVLMFSAKSW